MFAQRLSLTSAIGYGELGWQVAYAERFAYFDLRKFGQMLSSIYHQLFFIIYMCFCANTVPLISFPEFIYFIKIS